MRHIIPMKLSYWNDTINYCRANRFYANKKKQEEMDKISEYLKEISKIEKYPIRIDFIWHIKRVCDLDNKSVKSILDCMQKLEILENDDIKHINEIRHIAIKDKEDYVELEIIENDNA